MPRSLHTGRSVVSSNSRPPLELMLKATLLAVGLDVLSTMLSDVVPCDAGITCHTVHCMPAVELTCTVCYQLCNSCVANFKHSHPLRLSIGIGCGERHSPSCQRGKASSLSSTTCACLYTLWTHLAYRQAPTEEHHVSRMHSPKLLPSKRSIKVHSCTSIECSGLIQSDCGASVTAPQATARSGSAHGTSMKDTCVAQCR